MINKCKKCGKAIKDGEAYNFAIYHAETKKGEKRVLEANTCWKCNRPLFVNHHGLTYSR